MTDSRPDFETETFTPLELYVENGFKFGFNMKSWAQPHYGGSIVTVLGWLQWGYEDNGRRFPYADEYPCKYIDRISQVEKTIESFVCVREGDEGSNVLIIENIKGKGWMLN